MIQNNFHFEIFLSDLLAFSAFNAEPHLKSTEFPYFVFPILTFLHIVLDRISLVRPTLRN